MLEFVDAPGIEKNPNERVPLVAMVHFKANEPVTASIEINDGRRERTVSYDQSFDPVKGLPIIGMRADTDHTFSLTIHNQAGDTAGPIEMAYRTPPLPSNSTDLPRIRLVSSDPDRMEPGLTILSIRRSAPIRAHWETAKQLEFEEQWGMLAAVDEEGEIVW